MLSKTLQAVSGRVTHGRKFQPEVMNRVVSETRSSDDQLIIGFASQIGPSTFEAIRGSFTISVGQSAQNALFTINPCFSPCSSAVGE